jgi:uncharacterized membrane protein (UPF0127 family)
MRRVSVVNRTTSRTIFENAAMTEGFSERLTGLMFRNKPLEFDALVIDKCDSIHTFFMRFAIDAIFLNKEGRIIRIVKNIKPFRIILPISNACYVIECESRETTEQNFHTGDTIEFCTR